ncbi:MAG: fibronectin type III domain-containing protein, partial [Bacteroidales bacterium]|nr:fibronectin type III domain-containing protein [Bacteroidales bacterium]
MKTLILILILSVSLTKVFAIDAPANVSPTNGANNIAVAINLDWTTVGGNTGYIYQIDTTATFDSPLFLEGDAAVNTSNANVNSLYFGQTYYWRAAVKTATDTSNWSATTSFTTQSAIYNTSPANESINQPISVNIDWSSIGGNTGYIYQLDTIITFDSPVYDEGNSATNYSNINVSSLYFGATYYWRAAAINTVDTSEWSPIWSFTTLNNLNLVSPANEAINQNVYLELDWTGTVGIYAYQVEIDTVNTFNSTGFQLNETTNSYFYQSQLLFGQEYYWRVRACHINDTSNWSEIRNFTTKDTIYLVSPANGAINQNVYLELDWTNLTGSNSYQVEIDTVNTFNSTEFQLNETTSSYFYQSQLLFGQKYYWRVRAFHTNDTSNWSEIRNFTTKDTIILVSPSDGAINQNVYLELDWATLTGCSEYEWEIDTSVNLNSGLNQNGITTNSYFYVSNLHYNTIYFWRVRGRHAADTSGWSEVRTFTTHNSINLTSPSNGSINISIAPLLDYGSSVGNLGYFCEVDTSQNFNSDIYQLFESNAGVSQVNASGLLYGTTYYWRAATRNAVDTSGWSSVWHFTTAYELTNAPILLSPADESVNISYTTTSVQWNASTGAVTYQYQYSTDDNFETGIHSFVTSILSGTFSGLYPHTTYYWRGRGANANGYSPWSQIWEFQTESANLTPPVLVSPVNNATNINPDNIIIDWNSVFGASGYIYEITEDQNFVSGVVTQTITETEKEIIGLANGTQYFWRVKSTDGEAESDWSGVWIFTTANLSLSVPILTSPANNSIDLDFNLVTIDWENVSGASSYIYEYSTDETFTSNIITDIVSTSVLGITGLLPDTEYFWRIKATNGVLESEWSAIWSFKTIIDYLDAPTLTSPANNSENLNFDLVILDWEIVINASDYAFELSTDGNFTSIV